MIEESLAKDEENLIKYKIADVEKLPFEDSSFDTVVDTFGIQSYYDRNQALNEMKRVLKKGGKLLVMGSGASYLGPYNYFLRYRAGIYL